MPESKPNPYPGKLIAVEGIDGSGKSTQIYLVKRWLEMENVKVFFTEWNSSALVKNATKRGKKGMLFTPTTFSLLHCTDFADRYERQILPLLKAGYIVLCDRYMFTAFARDTVRGCHPDWVKNLYSFAVTPDITFYFKLPLEVSLGRILSGRPSLKFYEAGMDRGFSNDIYESFRIFQNKILDAYASLEKPWNFTVIDSTQSIEDQQVLVRGIVSERIDLAGYRWRIRR